MDIGQPCAHPPAAHHYDRPRGIVTCMQCGEVVTEEAFELDPAFARGEKAPAAPIRGGPGFARPQRTTQLGSLGASRPSIEAARRALGAIARQLDIPADHVEIAAGVYKQAVNINCVIGARSPVLCACLYIVCRRKGTAHMVLDFSDVTGDSPYWILKYLRLIATATGTAVPPVDASCYLARLAQQLDLGEQMHAIAVFALKILRAMKDDWIHTGRRPLGPCAAALIVASRAFGVQRSLEDLAQLVRLGEGTIALRIQEFHATDAAKLQDVDAYVPSGKSNPAAFVRGRQRDGDYAYLSHAMTLSATYWELVAEAREGAPATADRSAKWAEFWVSRESIRNRDRRIGTSAPAAAPQFPPLESLTPAQQLEILGLPQESVVGMKSEQNYLEEVAALLQTQELQAMVGAPSEGQPPTTQVAAVQAPPAEAPAPNLLSLSGPEGGGLDYVRRDRIEIILLPSMAEEDDALNEYIIHDLELRITREKAAQRTYGNELWDRGVAKEEPVLEPEDPRHQHDPAKARKRRRSEVVESATAAESVALGLKHRGAGQISIAGLAQLLPDVGRRAGSSVHLSEMESLDDEWPID